MTSIVRRAKRRSWNCGLRRQGVVPLHLEFIASVGPKQLRSAAVGGAFATISPDARLMPTPFAQKPLGAGWVLDGALSWNATISYKEHGRNDVVTVSGTSTQWSPVTIDFQGQVQGGVIALSIRAKVKKVATGAIDNVVWDGHATIKGSNPSSTEVRAALGSLQARVIAYKESRFQQFDAAGDPKFGPPNGFGLMQIDKNPSATARQLWDWKQNAGAGEGRFNSGAGVVRQHYANLRAAHPALPELAAEALAAAAYQYYNAGNVAFYWLPNEDNTAWVKNPDTTGTTYADDAIRIENLVSGGSPPGDW